MCFFVTDKYALTEAFRHALLMLLLSADSQRDQAPQGAVMAALVTYASPSARPPLQHAGTYDLAMGPL